MSFPFIQCGRRSKSRREKFIAIKVAEKEEKSFLLWIISARDARFVKFYSYFLEALFSYKNLVYGLKLKVWCKGIATDACDIDKSLAIRFNA